MLTPGIKETNFYIDGQLVDTAMLDYEAQRKHNGGRLHKVRQAISKLQMIAYEIRNGYGHMYDEEMIRSWVREAS